jgi:hypothetical protein
LNGLWIFYPIKEQQNSNKKHTSFVPKKRKLTGTYVTVKTKIKGEHDHET